MSLMVVASFVDIIACILQVVDFVDVNAALGGHSLRHYRMVADSGERRFRKVS
jgi:hypothetical protein